MGGILLWTAYALAVLVNVYLIARLTGDEDAIAFFVVPALSGPIMLVLAMAFIIARAAYRLGLEHAGRR